MNIHLKKVVSHTDGEGRGEDGGGTDGGNSVVLVRGQNEGREVV